MDRVRLRRPSGAALTTAAYFAMMVVIGVVYGATGPTLRGLAAQAGVGLAQIGVILSARSFGYFLATTVVGRLIDRVHAHRVAAGVIVIAAALVALIPAARSLWVLALLMAGLGMTLAGLDVGSNTLVLRQRADRPGPYMNALHLFFGVGGFLAPFLVALTGSETAISWPYWTIALLILPIAGWLLLRPAPERDRSTAEEIPSKTVRGLLFLGCVVFFFYVGAEIGLSTWIYEYARLSFPAPLATGMTSAFWASFTLFRLLGVLVSAKVRARTVAVADLAVGIAGAGLLAIGRAVPPLIWVGTILCGGAIASFYATFLVLLSERIPMTGQRMGIVALSATVGSMSFPWVIGRVFEAFPLSMPLIIGADLALALGLLAVLLKRDWRTA